MSIILNVVAISINDYPLFFQNLKSQIMTTNVWVEQVRSAIYRINCFKKTLIHSLNLRFKI